MITHPTSTPLQNLASLRTVSMLGAALLAGAIHAQSVPSKAAAQNNDEPIALSTFEVVTNNDTSYGALNSNSLTSFNVELKKLPISDDVMTREFIDDVAATSVDTLVSTFGLASGQSAVGTDGGSTTMNGDRPLSNSGNGGPTARGLTGGGTRVNGFQRGGAGLLFDVERAEIIQGPQGLLYGATGAGGVINTILNRARFDRSFGSVKLQFDEYGTKYLTTDSNWGNKKLGVRLDLQAADQHFDRLNLGGPVYAGYMQIAVQPWKNTVVRFSTEQATNSRIRNNNLTLNAPKGGSVSVADPRNAYPLRVLVATGQASDLDNGNVDYGRMDSFFGSLATERIETTDCQLSMDTRVNRWLSTQVAVMWDQWLDENAGAFQLIGLTPPGYSTNPFNTWALGFSPNTSTQLNRREAARLSGVIDFTFLQGKARNQTLFGADYWSNRNWFIQDQYYQADASWNVITNPALVDPTRNPLGRTLSPSAMWIAVPNGPLKYPLPLNPFADRYTNPQTGVNYVRQPANYIGGLPVTASNPDGYSGPAGAWTQISHSAAVYVADYIDWLDGRLTTLAGVRLENERLGRRGPALKPPELLINKKPASFNVGANFGLTDWLRPYVSYSNSTSVPNVLAQDPVGTPAKNPSGEAEEAGLKFNSHNNKISGTISFFSGTNTNDQYQIQGGFYNAINPNGGNGTVQPSSVWATVNRKARGVVLELTAEPTPNWRSRLALSAVNSTTESTRTYKQYYNDQFHADGSGGVTWSDGSPYMVAVTPGNTTGPQTQLTLAMLNGTDATNHNYVAVLDRDSGLITNRSAVFPTQSSSVHGTVFTGVAGLPISAIQLNWGDPNGHHGVIPVVYAGEQSPNFAKYQITWTNTYSFSRGPLRGLSIGGTVLVRSHTIGYYYNQTVFNSSNVAIGTNRVPFNLADTITLDPMISYQRKIGRFVYQTQLNVTNLLNNYHWQVFPNPASGAYNYSATYTQTPRLFTWTNTIKF